MDVDPQIKTRKRRTEGVNERWTIGRKGVSKSIRVSIFPPVLIKTHEGRTRSAGLQQDERREGKNKRGGYNDEGV